MLRLHPPVPRSMSIVDFPCTRASCPSMLHAKSIRQTAFALSSCAVEGSLQSSTVLGHRGEFLSPLRGLFFVDWLCLPTACAVGCILSLLRSFGLWSSRNSCLCASRRFLSCVRRGLGLCARARFLHTVIL